MGDKSIENISFATTHKDKKKQLTYPNLKVEPITHLQVFWLTPGLIDLPLIDADLLALRIVSAEC